MGLNKGRTAEVRIAAGSLLRGSGVAWTWVIGSEMGARVKLKYS